MVRITWPVILVVLILVSAFALRVAAAGWGLPYVDHHDEPSAANTILGMMRRGDWDPRFFEKPSLYYYALRLAFEAHFRYGLASGLYTGIADLPEATYYYTTVPGFFLWGRVLTAFVGAITTLALFLIGRRWWGTGAALVAAVVLAFSPIHVRHSQFLTVDVASALMTLLALGAALRLIDEGRRTGDGRRGTDDRQPTTDDGRTTIERRELRTENQELRTENKGTKEQKNKGTSSRSLVPSPQSLWRDYALAGLLVGLAASTKYNAGMVALAVVLAHVLRWRRESLRTFGLLLVAGGMSALGFLIGTPYALVSYDAFLAGMLDQYSNYVGQPSGDLNGYWPIAGYGAFFWTSGLMPPACIAALIGTAVVIARRDPTMLVLLGFAVPYVLFFAAQKQHFYRNLLPALPVFALLAGVGVVAVVTWTTSFIGRMRGAQNGKSVWIKRAIFMTVAAFVTIWPFARSVELVSLFAQPHSKVRAGNYVREHLPRGAPMALALNPVEWANQPFVLTTNDVAQYDAAWYRSQGFRYLVGNVRVNHERYRTLQEQGQVLAAFPGELDERPSPHMEALDLGFHLDQLAIERREAVFGEQVRLLGFQRGAGELRAAFTPLDGQQEVAQDEALLLNLYWQPLQQMQADYTIFLHLIDSQGRIVTQRDTLIRGYDYPTSRWQPNELALDLGDLFIPAAIPPGEYRLDLGVYNAQSMARLPVVGEEDGAVTLLRVKVKGKR
jgi:4-amino-4-deoxy-L-arabinose transferase-like glycosyltransferase